MNESTGAPDVPPLAMRRTGNSRAARFVVPALPWILAAALTAILPGYLQPMLTSPVGMVLLSLTLGLTLAGWLVYPTLVAMGPGLGPWLLRIAWAICSALPGIVLILIGPVAVQVSRDVRG